MFIFVPCCDVQYFFFFLALQENALNIQHFQLEKVESESDILQNHCGDREPNPKDNSVHMYFIGPKKCQDKILGI